MMIRERLSAIILAAGYSSRMGDFKPLLKLGSQTALERNVHLFRDAGVEDVRVVVGYRGEDVAPLLGQLGVPWVLNERFEEGMFSSLQAGIQSMNRSTKAFFVLPVDVPLVRVSTVRDLIDVFCKSTTEVAYPCFLGRRGHPPLISGELREAILTWKGQGGLRSFLHSVQPKCADVEVADECVLLDMNTPEHYRALLERFDDYDVPSAEECKVLLIEKCSVERRVLVHSCKVAEVAQRLCGQLKARGYVLNEKLILAAALLHDLAKGRPDHAATAAGILTRLGYHRVAGLVEAHMRADVAEDALVNELDIIRLADRVVEEDRVVHLEQKFQQRMERHLLSAGTTAAIRKRFADSKRLRQKVEEALGEHIGRIFSTEYESPHDVSADSLLTHVWCDRYRAPS